MGVLIQIPSDATIESNTGEGDLKSCIHSAGLVVIGVGVGQVAIVRPNGRAEPRGAFKISRVEAAKRQYSEDGLKTLKPAVIWSADSLPFGTTVGDLLFIE